MKFKFTLLILLLYALSSCGYAPIYSTKGVNFNIQKIEIFKKDRLNKTFKSKLEINLNVTRIAWLYMI